MIIQEMRQASRRYGIPIVTITQNNRMAENFSVEMSNNLIGDSIKKIRYSDTIVMIRQREDLDIFSEDVSKDVNINSTLTIDDSTSDFLKYIIPFEAKITKAKDGDKGVRKFHVFNKKNLRICEDIEELIRDHKQCISKSNDLMNQLAIIGIDNSHISNEIDFNDENPFDNLIF
jgi:hypothetical protein